MGENAMDLRADSSSTTLDRGAMVQLILHRNCVKHVVGLWRQRVATTRQGCNEFQRGEDLVYVTPPLHSPPSILLLKSNGRTEMKELISRE